MNALKTGRLCVLDERFTTDQVFPLMSLTCGLIYP